jgi:hypothetical protein
MSDPKDPTENFMQRWSRRKRAAKTPTSEDATPVRLEPPEAEAEARPSAPAHGEPDPAFDPTALPPIESITATSDVRAFLGRGVPEELTRAALRRAWVIDPTIRDFVGPAENQWDFTKPERVPGFGSLELTPDLRRIVASVFGDAPGRDMPPQGANAEQDEELAGRCRNSSQATTALTPDGGQTDVGRSASSSRVATSVINPKDSPVMPQSSKNAAAQQPSSNDWIEPDEQTIPGHGGAVET